MKTKYICLRLVRIIKKKKIGKHISHITLLEYLLMAIMVKDTITKSNKQILSKMIYDHLILATN